MGYKVKRIMIRPNGVEKQVYPTIPLKTYEEIIAMSINDAVAELNTYPTEYYNKFNSEGHIYNSRYLGTNGIYTWGVQCLVYDGVYWDKAPAPLDF